jgi:hypothetical protein
MAKGTEDLGREIRFYFPCLVTFNPEEVYLESQEFEQIAEIIRKRLGLPISLKRDPWTVFPIENQILESNHKIFCDFERFKIQKCEIGYYHSRLIIFITGNVNGAPLSFLELRKIRDNYISEVKLLISYIEKCEGEIKKILGQFRKALIPKIHFFRIYSLNVTCVTKGVSKEEKNDISPFTVDTCAWLFKALDPNSLKPIAIRSSLPGLLVIGESSFETESSLINLLYDTVLYEMKKQDRKQQSQDMHITLARTIGNEFLMKESLRNIHELMRKTEIVSDAIAILNLVIGAAVALQLADLLAPFLGRQPKDPVLGIVFWFIISMVLILITEIVKRRKSEY